MAQILPTFSDEPPPALRAGERVAGRYLVREPLGAGHWGSVFRAVHERLGRDVAIKVLTRGDDELESRFEHEAENAATVRHPNVLEVFDAGTLEDGRPFLVMELLDGHDLAAELEQGPLSIPATVEVGRQLASALGALADAGVVHRDLKPQNVVIHRQGHERVCKVVDFGISKAGVGGGAEPTDGGMVVGTPYYLSPEQVRGHAVDARSDLFSLGVVLYQCLTGHTPFTGASVSEVAAAILETKVPSLARTRPDSPRSLDRVVERLLERDPADRYQHPREVVEALDRVVRELHLATGTEAWQRPRPVASTGRSALPERTGRRWAWIAVAAFLAVLAAVSFGWIGPW